MKKCPKCESYTLDDNCPKCKTQTLSAHPPKYSFEDKYAKYRRQELYAKN